MKIETWDIGRLRPYDRNALKHPKRQIAQLQDSMRRYGQVWPVLVRSDGTVIAGHGRLEALKAEGATGVQVAVADGWTDAQCRAFTILDNQVARNSHWDPAMLKAELAGLIGAVDLKGLGFSKADLAKLIKEKEARDPDELPDTPARTVSRLGDIWCMGRHTLICGDATDAETVKLVLDGSKPDLMVTDPPYGVAYDPTWRVGAKSKGLVKNDHRADWREAWALFPGKQAYVWHGGLHAPVVQESLEAAGFHMEAMIIWVKQQLVFSRGDYHWQHEPCWHAIRGKAPKRVQGPVWEISNNIGNAEKTWGHGTQKPVECMKRPIEQSSQPGDTVYEPFSGSGTTIIAGEITGRSVRAVELDPAYCDMAVLRWEEWAGQKAVLAKDGSEFEELAAARAGKD